MAAETESPPRPFFATAAKGTEGALRDELRELRVPSVRADRGGVHFGGTLLDAMRVCYGSRIAVRVLARRGEFPAGSELALYEGARALDLSDVLDPTRTLSVSATVKNSRLTHSGYVAQKVKDALVDAQRAQAGRRSDVNRDDPDVRVVVHLDRDTAQVFLDLAGEALHKRGYRTESREAPIKETLAAAMLRLSGWDRTRPLVDPMCGSGTLAIEGLMWARNIAPGLLGRRYGFQRWACYGPREKDEMIALRETAGERVLKATDAPSVIALDCDALAVQLARKLARNAGVNVHVDRMDAREFMGVSPAGHVITNPPYGVRIARDEQFETGIARAFRRLSGHRISAICHDARLAEAMATRPQQEHTLFNGDLECRLFSWDI
ncbi:MAG: hypothetical protein RL385_3598 [Pseudomonadota bacterium]|jgi:putative N6-adenine-specific DNA methylase